MIQRLGTQILGEYKVVIIQQLGQLGRQRFRMEQVVHAQRTTRHFVFIGRADAFTGGADLGVATTLGFTRAIQRGVIRQDNRAARADGQATAHLEAISLQCGDFAEQVVDVEDDAVTDVAMHTIAHNTRGHEVQLVLFLANHQRMAGIVAALETHDPAGVVCQPVDDLAFAFITPLGPYDYDIFCHTRLLSK